MSEVVYREPEKETPRVLRMLALLWGSFFFTGFAPIASGTVGSLAALALYWVLPFTDNGVILLLLAFSIALTGIPAATVLEREYGDDPSIVVVDEAAGMWLALCFLPKTLLAAGIAFLLFRLFDIVKPSPARQFDRMRGGGGIIMDDVVAGVYACVATHIVLLFL
ncbi:MAG TPA: phosphatidylglycerophosphatase A [Bacteroidota bacterium]|nr:phosphatidylglycerophosphatase A [Bacteroidota bacterium]